MKVQFRTDKKTVGELRLPLDEDRLNLPPAFLGSSARSRTFRIGLFLRAFLIFATAGAGLLSGCGKARKIKELPELKPGRVYSIRDEAIEMGGTPYPYAICKVLAVDSSFVTYRVFENRFEDRPAAPAAEMDFSNRHIEGIGMKSSVTAGGRRSLVEFASIDPVFFADSPLSDYDRQVIKEAEAWPSGR